MLIFFGAVFLAVFCDLRWPGLVGVLQLFTWRPFSLSVGLAFPLFFEVSPLAFNLECPFGFNFYQASYVGIREQTLLKVF